MELPSFRFLYHDCFCFTYFPFSYHIGLLSNISILYVIISMSLVLVATCSFPGNATAESGAAKSIRVDNKANVQVSVQWQNITGDRKSYGVLYPRQTLTVPTPPPGGWFAQNIKTGQIYSFSSDTTECLHFPPTDADPANLTLSNGT